MPPDVGEQACVTSDGSPLRQEEILAYDHALSPLKVEINQRHLVSRYARQQQRKVANIEVDPDDCLARGALPTSGGYLARNC